MSKRLEFNLLPPEYYQDTSARALRLSLLVSAALTGLACLGLNLVCLRYCEVSLNELAGRLSRGCSERLQPLDREQALLTARVSHLAAALKPPGLDPALLEKLSTALEDRGWLTRLAFDGAAAELSLGGFALRSRQVPEIMARLSAIPGLEEVRLVRMRRQMLAGKEVAAFSFSARPAQAPGPVGGASEAPGGNRS